MVWLQQDHTLDSLKTNKAEMSRKKRGSIIEKKKFARYFICIIARDLHNNIVSNALFLLFYRWGTEVQ